MPAMALHGGGGRQLSTDQMFLAHKLRELQKRHAINPHRDFSLSGFLSRQPHHQTPGQAPPVGLAVQAVHIQHAVSDVDAAGDLGKRELLVHPPIDAHRGNQPTGRGQGLQKIPQGGPPAFRNQQVEVQLG